MVKRVKRFVEAAAILLLVLLPVHTHALIPGQPFVILKNRYPTLATKDTQAAQDSREVCQFAKGFEPLLVELVRFERKEVFCLAALDCAFKSAKLNWQKTFTDPDVEWKDVMCLEVGCKRALREDRPEGKRPWPDGTDGFHELRICPPNADGACPTSMDCKLYGAGPPRD